MINKVLNNEKREERKIYIYSGAGISEESGITTFRGNNGLWENYKISEVCDFRTWEHNYDLVHDFYNKRRLDLEDKKPNEAHNIIRKMQKKFGTKNIINVTTNIDDLFEKAKVKNTVHLHGYLHEMVDFQKNKIIKLIDPVFEDYRIINKKYKPNVTFFNEPAPQYVEMQKNSYNMKDGDIVICVGMSFNVIHPLQLMPFNKNITSININLGYVRESSVIHCRDESII